MKDQSKLKLIKAINNSKGFAPVINNCLVCIVTKYIYFFRYCLVV